MPRKGRIVLEGLPHHVTQRGNNQQDVFFVDDDREVYLELLKKQSQLFGLDVLSYCLMTNHIHIVAIPQTADSLAKAVGRTHLLYTQYINKMHKRSGHLWQNRFFSCPIGDSYVFQTIQYVENNPVRAAMCERAIDYKYSSAKAHIEGYDPAIMVNLRWWRNNWQGNWGEYLSDQIEDEYVGKLKVATSRGRPLANDSFMSKIEKITGRRLRPLPVGRPKKVKGDDEDSVNG